MATATRISLIFQYTSQPQDSLVAIPHTGGWSESYWTQALPAVYLPAIQFVAQKRALLLAQTAAIVGSRFALYNISGNKLLPGGTSTAQQLVPGVSGVAGDIPQMGIEVTHSAFTAPNASRSLLRGLGDIFCQGGEYFPTPALKTKLSVYFSALIPNFGFVGRDLSQQSVRVVSYTNGVLVTDVPLPGVVVGSWVRFHRCRDNVNVPITGAYQITLINGNTYTLSVAPQQQTNRPNGTVRIDLLTYLSISGTTVGRIGVRKVGRPSQGYRGRRSKRLAK